MIALGNVVRDTITGFTGIAIGRTEWLYGCTRIGIEPTKLHDGKPIEPHWFDEQRVEVVKRTKPKVSAASRAAIGGPKRDPKRPAAPTR